MQSTIESPAKSFLKTDYAANVLFLAIDKKKKKNHELDVLLCLFPVQLEAENRINNKLLFLSLTGYYLPHGHP